MRTKKAQIRKPDPDGKYGSTKVTKLVNYVMNDGKKTVAQKQVYIALEKLGEATGKKPVEAFEEVLRVITPQMEESLLYESSLFRGKFPSVRVMYIHITI